MRRFVSLAVLLFFTVPFGLSVVGCGHKAAPVVFCNGGDTGPVAGQVKTITLSQTLAVTGESLNFAQIGQALSASAVDCKNNPVSVTHFTYGSTSSFTENTAGGPIFADINPSTGQVCGGTWNRNTGGGIPDYTTCSPPSPLPSIPPAVPLSAPATLPTVKTTIPPPVPIPTAPTALSFQYTVPAAGMLTIQGGAVSSVTTAVTSGTAPNPGATSGSFFVLPQETVTIAYTTSATIPAPALSLAEAYSYSASSAEAIQVTGGGVTSIYDYVAQTGRTAQETTSGVFQVQQGDLLAVSYTSPPTLIAVPPQGVAFVTATADGATSNAVPVFVHPVVTGVVLGGPSALCTDDPGTDCCAQTGTSGTPPTAAPYTGNSCLSQGTAGQLIGRVYANGAISPANNITCEVGHLTFSPLDATNVVSIDQNGVATANQPGSAIIAATVAQSSSGTQAGFFSTCPPKSIQLTIPGQSPSTTSIDVSLNNTQPLVATVLDTNGMPITGLSLEFNSTTPQTIPAGTGAVTPTFPGTATITAVCQPGACNPSPFNQIGYLGNGEPLTSNGITVTATGSSSTVIYMGSTDSQYIVPHDFTTNTPSAPIKLPYIPNSMVITQDGTSIYLGSPEGLMSIATASNALTGANQNVTGTVLSVAPSGAYVVITDPVRQTISLYTPGSGAAATTYGGVATSAQWSPDSNTVYITTTTNTLLTYSTFTNWQPTATVEPYTDVAVLVPSVGAYFSGGKPGSTAGVTDGRSYCSSVVSTTPGNPPTEINTFSPLADENATVVDQVATTTNGLHLLGAHATSATAGPLTFTDFDLTIPSTAPCTGTVPSGLFRSTPFTQTLAVGVKANAVDAVVPTTNSALAFVTYSISGATGGGVLPFYVVPSTGAGTFQYLTLGNGATAASSPLSGVVSTDNLTFYAGTGDATALPSPTSNSAGPATCNGGSSADNDVHLFSLAYPSGGGAPSVAETGILSPNLPYTMVNGVTPVTCSAGYAPVNLLVQRPKRAID